MRGSSTILLGLGTAFAGPFALPAPPDKGCASPQLPGMPPGVGEDCGPPLRLDLNAGAYPGGRLYPLGRPFEVFRSGWEAHRVSAELGETWNALPLAIKVELSHAFTPAVGLFVRGGLRRDLSAWHQDSWGGNWPHSEREVDLNQPMLGYLWARNAWSSLAFGRFPVHWSPSSEYGLTLSRSVPHHNAAMATLGHSFWRYHFLVSSLNPWLQGTPTGDTSSSNFPVGSEEWRQRNYPGRVNDNAHLRVYDARMKTLVAHRLEASWGRLKAGITEMNVLGGKPPDLLDLNPFSIYHNDFKDGPANGSVSLDARLELPRGFALSGEMLMDDLRYSDTEGDDSPSVLGFLGGLEHAWTLGKLGLRQSIHAIQTDALLYRAYQPYKTLHSRMILTSNNQEENLDPFVDKYVVDYPLGYARGGDALDYRYAARLEMGPYQGLLRLEYLTHGGATLDIPYEDLFDGRANTDSLRSEEWRASLSASRDFGAFTVHAGLAGQVWLFPARQPRAEGRHFQVDLGLSWRWP